MVTKKSRLYFKYLLYFCYVKLIFLPANGLYEEVIYKINPSRIHYSGALYNNTSLKPKTLKEMLKQVIIFYFIQNFILDRE